MLRTNAAPRLAAPSVKSTAKRAAPKGTAKPVSRAGVASKAPAKRGPVGVKHGVNKPVAKAEKAAATDKKPAAKPKAIAKPTPKPAPSTRAIEAAPAVKAPVPPVVRPLTIAPPSVQPRPPMPSTPPAAHTNGVVAAPPPPPRPPTVRPSNGFTHNNGYIPPPPPPFKAVAFKVGDKAVHPSHGVGEVTAIEQRDIGGAKQMFYVLRILDNGMKVMVPTTAAQQVGLRGIMSDKEANAILTTMKAREVAVDVQPWSRRFRVYTEMIKSGSPTEVAKVLRDMNRLKFDKDLSFGERRLLDQAKSLLLKELAFAKKKTEPEMAEEIRKIFSA